MNTILMLPLRIEDNFLIKMVSINKYSLIQVSLRVEHRYPILQSKTQVQIIT